MSKAIIFDIKRYAIHDGPGIRTTLFFKGCALQCQWCHNPEGIDSNPELIFYSKRCSKECEACLTSCPQDAIDIEKGSVHVDRVKCDLCGHCEEACVYGALEIVGRELTVQEVLEEVEKDRIFFDESGGGVTLSGGEPLAQFDFLEALLDALEERKVHVALDTSGHISFEQLERISDKTDLFLYDIKTIDDKKHEKYTGISNKEILENLRYLSSRGKPVIVRIPLISKINDDVQSIKMAAEYLDSLKNIKQINLLPYHKGGCEKYRLLGKEKSLKVFQPPSNERIEKIKKFLSNSDFLVKVGG
ncbi:MAG: glycyl-radical enzyme activating protein [Candidatus Aminicenantaceae bacterium]